MPKKTKFRLEELQVRSFTTVSNAQKLVGGSLRSPCLITPTDACDGAINTCISCVGEAYSHGSCQNK